MKGLAVQAESGVIARSFVRSSRGRSAALPRARQASLIQTLPSQQVWLIATMLFFLTAANGRPFWWNSAVPAALIALWLIVSRGPGRVLEQALSKINKPIFFCLLALTAWTALSTMAHLDSETSQIFLLRCLLPLAIYLSVVGLPLRPMESGVCVLAVVAGSSLPLISGLLAFYRESGIPDARELLYARYDVSRMADYMNVTFGNVGHVGMYAAIVTPCVLVAMYAGVLKRRAIALCGGWMLVVIANTIISGSRTSWAVGIAVGALLILALQRGRTIVLLAAVLIGCSVYIASVDVLDEALLTERLLPSMGRSGRDTSVEERMESIEAGWDTFTANVLLGIGPGMSSAHNVYDVPHQSVVMVASETGVIGGLSFLLLNLVVLGRTTRHAWRAKANMVDRRRLIWIVGPASWLVGGALAGLTFNMNLALLWIGIAHAMLGLYGFEADPRPLLDKSVRAA